MTPLDVLDDDEHWPEYGTLVVTDARPEAGVDELPMLFGLLEQGGVGTQPAGTIARAGDGWLEARATDDLRLRRWT